MRFRSTTSGALLAAALGTLLLAGCQQGVNTTTTSWSTGTPATGASVAQLDSITIAPDGPLSGYSRAQFGDGWATQPDGCDSRVDVLAAQVRPGTLVRHGCTITGGTWLSLYDGVTVTSPHQLDIDHLVPLAEAWKTGARGWSPSQRVAFANDVTTELIAVTAHSNRSKGDEPPPGYEPPNKAEDCSYAARWVAVKVKYRLTVTAGEKTALAQMLATCSNGGE